MRNALLLPLVVAVAIALALWARVPPSDDGATGYSLVEANKVLDAIAREPRPVGSPGNAKAREWLKARFAELGLEVSTQAGIGVRQANFDALRKGSVNVSPYENIIAVLPGSDRTQKAVALMAHVDSAPWANGASDDAAGVAALVESARVLAAGPKPKRDVVFLVTDAEELGLIGAQEFFDRHPLAARIGAVINVEARGSRGRAFMFQTSPGNAGLVDLWADHAIAPSGNSLANNVYKLLPNDTDLSVPLAKGVTGINAAFIDGLYDYHMPTDNIENLDPNAMRHLGNFALTTARALAMADAIPAQAKDASYFYFFGLFVVRYPMWGGWVLLVMGFAILLFAQVQRLGVSWKQALSGVAGIAALMVGTGAISHFIANWAYGAGMIPMRERINEMDAALWIFVALAAVWFAGSTEGGDVDGCDHPYAALRTRRTNLDAGGGVAVRLDSGDRCGISSASEQIWSAIPAALYGSAVVGGIWGALLLTGVIATYVSVAPMTPAPVVLIIPFAVTLIAPVIMAFGEKGWSRWVGAGLVVAAAIGSIVFAFSDSFSARHPKPGDLFHYSGNGKSYWVTTSTARQLPQGPVSKIKPKGFDSVKWLGTAAPASAIAAPAITLTQDGRLTTLRMSSDVPPRLMNFMVTPSRALSNIRVNGRPVKLPVGKATRIGWRAETPNAELVLQFESAGAGHLAIDYLYAIPGMPAGAPSSGGPDTDWTLLNGSRVVNGSAKLDFAPE